MLKPAYDRIIIGAGSAVPAARLTENENVSVLLEAGLPGFRLDFRPQMPAAPPSASRAKS